MLPLRFLHIPKTAGTTFTGILNHQYLRYGKFQLTGDIKSDIEKFEQLPIEEQDKIVLYTGHAPIATGIPTIDDVDVITFLRDPVSRVKSFCQHVSEGKSAYLLEHFSPDSFDLDKFLNSPVLELSNLQTKMLVNKGASAVDFKMDPEQALEKATNHLLNKIKVFGLVEYFDESLILFKQAFAWQDPVYQRLNSKDRHKLITFEPRHIQRIKTLNALDIELYDRARVAFLERINDASFDSEQVIQLKKRNSQQKSNPDYTNQVKNLLLRVYQKIKKPLG